MSACKRIILTVLLAGFSSSVFAGECDGISDGYIYTYREGDNCANGADHCINEAVSAWHYCTGNLYFLFDVNSKNANCYTPDSMDCSKKPGVPKSLKNYCEGKENGIHANPQTCTKFINCSNGITYFMDCPKGLYFNTDKNECDYDANVDCIVHN